MKKLPYFEITILLAFVFYVVWNSRPQPETVEKPVPNPHGIMPNYQYHGLLLAPVPLESSADDFVLAEMMDLKVWKFAVETTIPGAPFDCIVELREKGKRPLELTRAAFHQLHVDPKTRRGYFWVMILPRNADFSHADEWKVMVKIGGVSSTKEIKNPLKGALSSGTPNSFNVPDVPLYWARVDADPFRGSTGKYRELTIFVKFARRK